MKQYDIIVIGSGMGGLVCADILSREGYSVCVLEKNKQIGGSLQTYARDKVVFDSGVHYVGALGKGQNLYQIFTYLGLMDKLKLQQMDMDAFDRVLIENDEKEYRFAQGYENFIQGLLADFPQEEAALRQYCAKIKEVCSCFPLYNLRAGSDSEKTPVLGIGAKEFIESVTANKKLQAVLAGTNYLYAGEPDQTPFYVHALILNHYIESAWKCVDGGSQLAKAMAANIRRHGGEILRHSQVTCIKADDDKVTHVQLANGRQLSATAYISNMHPVKTLEMTDAPAIKKVYRKRLKSLRNSVSSFTLNIVFKKESFLYLNHNYYYQKEGHTWDMTAYTEENWPLGYCIFVPATSKGNQFAEGMSILTYMRYEEVKEWEDTFNTVSSVNSRGESYEAFKIRKAERLLDEVEKKFAGIRQCILSYYCATPLSFRDYIGNDDGSMYGIMKDYKDPLKTFIPPQTKLNNLFFTGQNLNLHGILGCTISGIMTCTAVMGNDSIIEKIKHA
ncbi:MAG TPA: NAD(P)/FAD-dependent oxidoreductase [Chitinophagaceae bacterium]|nr:NAD(P)/FAD-dependent oxidoreductase [Chitinophagaceae bacterium]